MKRLIGIVTLMTLSLVAIALDCSQCGKEITGRYLRTDTGVFCSQACLEATLPTCDVCGKRLKGRYLSSNGKRFCSDTCYETVLAKCELCQDPIRQGVVVQGHRFCHACAEKDRCAECQLPFDRGVKLKDGRHLCRSCQHESILTVGQARAPYELARRELQKLTGIAIPAPPPLSLVGRDVLVSMMNNAVFQADKAVVRGFYNRRENIKIYERMGRETRREVDLEEEILMLYGQTRENFLATAIHELTHDLVADHFPRLNEAPLWVEEGICQYMAATYCRHLGFTAALAAIEESPNPVYGDGYRFFKNKLGDNNWTGLKHWMQTVDVASLPATAN